MKKYKDSWCRPVTTREGTRIAGGAARNYLLGLYANGIDDVINRASAAAARSVLDDMRSKLDVDLLLTRATRASKSDLAKMED